MHTSCTYIPVSQTGYFSKLVEDYISGSEELKPFYVHKVNQEGFRDAILARQKVETNRELLTGVLNEQYASVQLTEKQIRNIELLSAGNTFTVTTAHQPNIFTGYLYFVYKILHSIRLAEELKEMFPENHFVPFYYMGSEDADLEELGHIYLEGEKLEWNTGQSGAVGRMEVDKALLQLIAQLEGSLSVLPFGKDAMALLKQCYIEGRTIESATFHLVNELFASFGLLVLLPDNPKLKRNFIPVLQKELLEQFSHEAVAETAARFPNGYKVQAGGRELNLFYLEGNSRERIERSGSEYFVNQTGKKFTQEEILAELEAHPERFSPNVIIRPVFQEMILPNIAFIGGGGEIAYWLELKKVFESVQVPYPVLILRNSFLFIDREMKLLEEKLGIGNNDLFQSTEVLLASLVRKESASKLDLANETDHLNELYNQLYEKAGLVDITLRDHVNALRTASLKKIGNLGKKMLRAEKRRFEAQQRQLAKLKERLFPNNGLQERVNNLFPYYSKYGAGFIEMLYRHSAGWQQQFGIIEEKSENSG